MICEHWKMSDSMTVVIVDEVDEELGIASPEAICDACRRKLCTCERCSAFDTVESEFPNQSTGRCREQPPRVVENSFEPIGVGNLQRQKPVRCYFMGHHPETNPDGWCLQWRQARPWTLDEARGWLGLVGESMAVTAAEEAPDGWQEQGP